MSRVTGEYGCYDKSIREKDIEEVVFHMLQRLGEMYGEGRDKGETDKEEREGRERNRQAKQEFIQC